MTVAFDAMTPLEAMHFLIAAAGTVCLANPEPALRNVDTAMRRFRPAARNIRRQSTEKDISSITDSSAYPETSVTVNRNCDHKA